MAKRMMIHGVYIIKCGGKAYVGSSVDCKVRIRKHLLRLRSGDHHCKHLQNSFNKNGEESFSVITVCPCGQSRKNLRELEAETLLSVPEALRLNSTLSTFNPLDDPDVFDKSLKSKMANPSIGARISAGLKASKRAKDAAKLRQINLEKINSEEARKKALATRMTEEFKKKDKEIRLNSEKCRESWVRVELKNIKTGQVSVYDSITIASRSLNKRSPTGISMALKGNREYCGYEVRRLENMKANCAEVNHGTR